MNSYAAVWPFGLDIFLWPLREECVSQNFLAFFLLSLFCVSGGFLRVSNAMELPV